MAQIWTLTLFLHRNGCTRSDTLAFFDGWLPNICSLLSGTIVQWLVIVALIDHENQHYNIISMVEVKRKSAVCYRKIYQLAINFSITAVKKLKFLSCLVRGAMS